MDTPHWLYLTQVMHRRLHPAPYRFVYNVFSWLLDLDALEQAPPRLRWGPVTLVDFSPRRHGPRDGTPLRPWVERVLAARGIDLAGGRIRLLCFPRVLGYVFNPLSVWYCEHRDGTLRAVLAEVSNTFGEHHVYLLSAAGAPLTWPLRGTAAKCFHVSPLMPMGGSYRFRLARPGTRLAVLIRQFDAQGRLILVASQTGHGMPLTEQALWRVFARMPLMTFKVIAAIHWEALKIWLRGTPPVPTPPAPPEEVT